MFFSHFFIVCTEKVVALSNLVLSHLMTLFQWQFFQVHITSGIRRSPFREQTHYCTTLLHCIQSHRRFKIWPTIPVFKNNCKTERNSLDYIFTCHWRSWYVKCAIHLLEIVINWSVINSVCKPLLLNFYQPFWGYLIYIEHLINSLFSKFHLASASGILWKKGRLFPVHGASSILQF